MFHGVFHDLFLLVRETAQAHPFWCLPIAGIVAFSALLTSFHLGLQATGRGPPLKSQAFRDHPPWQRPVKREQPE